MADLRQSLLASASNIPTIEQPSPAPVIQQSIEENPKRMHSALSISHSFIDSPKRDLHREHRYKPSFDEDMV